MEKRGAPHNYKNLIDHFATNHPNYILKASVLKSDIVDHYFIFGIRKINPKKLKR